MQEVCNECVYSDYHMKRQGVINENPCCAPLKIVDVLRFIECDKSYLPMCLVLTCHFLTKMFPVPRTAQMEPTSLNTCYTISYSQTSTR
jgi:hypothetical protein